MSFHDVKYGKFFGLSTKPLQNYAKCYYSHKGMVKRQMGSMNLKAYLTVGDNILIGALLVLSLAGFPLVRSMTKAGNLVQIETDGKVYRVVSLHEDQALVVPGPLGETSVIIHDGEVYVSESPCRNKICIKTGHISLAGQMIACVPNKAVVRITGEQEAGYDAITQ
ncbi:hypothetical protein CSA56_02275 [candidate division KSB3 bacterium]|uniref:Uncharacterized protein n=1 Tax=candidate division KSB3 bacterium TaxID=2044937 RepID=A0A2G6KJQ8_9BACT|nr:MAG: hypothetical protein CSA56_02275 [candidate division KSB3 bacterium]